MLNATLALTAFALPAVVIGATGHERGHAPHKPRASLTCPVTKKPLPDPAKAQRLMVNNAPVYLCSPGCIGQIKSAPAKHLKTANDPVSGKPFRITAQSPKMAHDRWLFLFSSRETLGKFHAEPGKYMKHGNQYGHAGSHEEHRGHQEGHGGRHEAARKPAEVAVGQKVPEFSVTDVGGKTWSLSELRKSAPSGVVSLTFWCSFCHSCRDIEKRLDQLAGKYRGEAAVVALDASAGETPDRVAAFAKKTGLSLPILLDGAGRTADLFGVGVTTTTVVIDRAGVLRYRGRFADGQKAYAADAVSALLANKQVPVTETALQG